MILPHKPESELPACLEVVFDRWQAILDSAPCLYCSDTDDFGQEISTLMIAAETNDHPHSPDAILGIHDRTPSAKVSFTHTPRNLAAIAPALGISLFHTDSFYYVRDHFLHLGDGSTGTSRASEHLEAAAFRTHSSNLYLHKTAATHTKNQLFNSWTGHTKSGNFSPNLPPGLGLEVLPSSYIEGGNCFALTNCDGRIKACIGSDHLMQTLQILELENRSWHKIAEQLSDDPAAYEARIATSSSRLTSEDIVLLAEEMFAAGLLVQGGKLGLIHPKNQLSLMLLKYFSPLPIPAGKAGEIWFRRLAVEASTIPKFELCSTDIASVRHTVAAYDAKKILTHELMAKELKILPSDLHFIPQANYHLDTFLTPGPHHSTFITNYALVDELLACMEMSADALNLSNEDRSLLTRYRSTAQKLHRELGPLLKAAGVAIQNAGLQLIQAPLSFIYEPELLAAEFPLPKQPLSINFANALTGWSGRTGKFYYITHGMQAGKRLGKLFMDTLALFLQRYIPNIETYFIGRTEADPCDYSEAMDWWNRLETQSGIHCCTWPTTTHHHHY